MSRTLAAMAENEDQAQWRLLLEVGRDFNSSLDFHQVLDNVMDRVIEVFGAERGCLFLKDESGSLNLVCARGLDKTTIEDEDFSTSRSVLQKVMETGEPLLSSNAALDPSFKQFASVSFHALRSIMAVPVIFRGETKGLIYVDNRIQAGVFNYNQVDLLTMISQQAAGAIENARLYETRKQIILVLANAIEAKDLYTRGHIERVCKISVDIGKELKLSQADLHDLEMASFLHDAGKIGVPDAVLQKAGKLTEEERAQMEKHAALGEALVLPIDIPSRVKKAIRQHQERYDGEGYPDRLKGDEIHLFARIIAVADTWDAMTSDRVYRKALGRDIAVAELQKAAGKQLDPDIVEAFVRLEERQFQASRATAP
jgi:HD-GYP domain-containing protein (c-di-GMP phosphodiesterase class II)